MILVDNICEDLSLKILSGELLNGAIVEIIEHLGRYLNLQTVPDYAMENKMSEDEVRKSRTVQKLFNVDFVIDNE